MKNELFKRLQKSNPELARTIANDPKAMKQLEDMEADRVKTERNYQAEEMARLLLDFVPGLTIETFDV